MAQLAVRLLYGMVVGSETNNGVQQGLILHGEIDKSPAEKLIAFKWHQVMMVTQVLLMVAQEISDVVRKVISLSELGNIPQRLSSCGIARGTHGK